MVDKRYQYPNHSKNPHLIDTLVYFNGSNGAVKITWVYGHPVWEEQIKVWDAIRYMGSNRTGHWMCIVDFNDVSYSYEKEGGRPKDTRKMDAFNSLISDMSLVALDLKETFLHGEQ